MTTAEHASTAAPTADTLQGSRDEWRQQVLAPYIAEHPPLRDTYRTASGEIEVETIYEPRGQLTSEQVEHYETTIGRPGSYPFTRGRVPSGHRSLDWRPSFYSGFGDARQANQRMRQLIANGADTVRVAIDLPSQCGYDPDHPMARADVGKVGVAISSLDDFERLFQDVPLERVGTGTVGNCIGPIVASMFSAVAERQGVDPGEVRVTLQNDPLKEFTGRGTMIVPAPESVELAADVVEYCIERRRRWIPQYACSTQLRWGGVNASQEMGLGLANLVAYVDAVHSRGHRVEDFVPRMEGLHMTTDNDFFEEIAKFRATRRLWARIARERWDTSDPGVLGLKITTFTGAHRLTAQQPLNNVTRTAAHVLASLLGGVERLTVPAHDEALALPTEESTWVADVSKLIMLYECGIVNTVDPLAGSYYLEELTDELEHRAQAVFDEVQSIGGAAQAIHEGYYEELMTAGMREQQRWVESGERTVIGVNEYASDEEVVPELFRVDTSFYDQQLESLEALRARRDSREVERSLDWLGRVLEEKREGATTNSVPAFDACVRAGATMGELGQRMRDVLGVA